MFPILVDPLIIPASDPVHRLTLDSQLWAMSGSQVLP